MMKMEKIASQLREAIGPQPFIVVAADDNLMSSVYITMSASPKEQWANGILENSHYFRMSITGPNRYYTEGEPITAEIISGDVSSGKNVRHWPKFRKMTGPPEKVVAKIAAYIQRNKDKS